MFRRTKQDRIQWKNFKRVYCIHLDKANKYDTIGVERLNIIVLYSVIYLT